MTTEDFNKRVCKPGARPGNGMRRNDTEHNSCWECEFIRVGSFPERRCAVRDNVHVWASLWAEVDGLENENEKTVADTCQWFRYDESLCGGEPTSEVTDRAKELEQEAKLDYAKDQLNSLRDAFMAVEDPSPEK
jgi:hypothetical protein